MMKKKVPFDKKILLVSVLAVVISYALMILLTPMTYHTNDEVSIAGSLAGAELGSIHWFHKFINAAASVLVGSLYMLFPGVKWWYLFLQLFIVLGMLLTNYGILKITELGKNIFLGLAGILIVDATLFWFWIAGPAYTTSPGILGIGIISLIFIYADKEKKEKKKLLVFVAVAVFFMEIVRYRTAECLFCFIMLALLVVLTKDWKRIEIKGLIQWVLYGVVLILMILGVNRISNKIKSNINDAEFKEFNSARVQFMDHGHDSYNQNPEMYDAIGWDEDIVSLASAWKFMMKEVTAENLKYAYENSNSHVANRTFYQNLKESGYNILKSKSLRVWLLLWIGTAAGGICLLWVRRKRFLFYWFCNNAGTAVLITYIACGIGRVNLRGLYVILAPSCVMNLYLTQCVRNDPADADTDGVREKNCKRISLAICMLVCALIAVTNVKYTLSTAQSHRKTEQKQIAAKIYYAEHPDNIYFPERSWNISPWVPKSIGNSKSMGGSGWLGASHKRWLAKYGFESMSCDLFELDNVYYVGEKSTTTLTLTRYMQNHCDALGLAVVDEIEGLSEFYVFHFVYEDNADQYDSYLRAGEEGFEEVRREG